MVDSYSFGAKLAAEEAKGIPSRSTYHPLPTIKQPTLWEYGVHRHEATVRGLHHDLRLGDPKTGHAHSWAVENGLPSPGESVWAIQQPTHTVAYMDFKGSIPEGEYGAGKVTLADRGKTEINNSRPDHITFHIFRGSGPEEYTLHKIRDDMWKLYGRTITKKNVILPESKPAYKSLEEHNIDFKNPDQLMMAKDRKSVV